MNDGRRRGGSSVKNAGRRRGGSSGKNDGRRRGGSSGMNDESRRGGSPRMFSGGTGGMTGSFVGEGSFVMSDEESGD